MKTVYLSALLLTGLMLTMSFTKPNTKKVDTGKSKVNWLAKKVTGQHSGTIAIKSGSVVFDNGRPVSGNFEMDMKSIMVTDMQGEYAEKLKGHLKSADFFNVDAHPTAKFVLKSAAATIDPKTFLVTGDITILGVTQTISFDAKFDADRAMASIKVDRTKFGIKYGSGSFFDNLGDKAIDDVFDLNVDLAFAK